MSPTRRETGSSGRSQRNHGAYRTVYHENHTSSCGPAIGRARHDTIHPMNPKQATALLGVGILILGEIAGERHASIVPSEHIHAEMRTEPVAATAAPISASGTQGVFDPAVFDSGVFDVGYQ